MEPKGASSPLLEVRDLRVGFGGRAVVKGVSFAVGAGETLGLVGESGSGKSVTSLALMRLLGPEAAMEGEVWLRTSEAKPAELCGGTLKQCWLGVGLGPMIDVNALGREDVDADGGGSRVDLLRVPERVMRGHRGRSLAMVFQEPMTALNPVMPIGRQVGEAVLAHAPRTSRAEVRRRVLEVLHAVALPDPERRLGDYPHQFSGGQRQRIVIAMALINRPRLVIADEPTTALDVTVQAQILALLKVLKTEYGLAMLFISHDLAVVGQVADRIAVMRHGAIVETGTAHEVLTRPQHPYTQGLLAAAPTMRTPRGEPLRQGLLVKEDSV